MSRLPVRAKLDGSGLYVALAAIPRDELRDPFLHETVRRIRGTQSLVHVVPEELGRMPDSAAPAGMIFHVARCGSTLVSQLLKQSDALCVYAEPTALNELLTPPHPLPHEHMVAALRSLAKLFAEHAGGAYVLKLSSWNALWCTMVAQAFPSTPWVFCLRDPLEVCASLVTTRPGWLQDQHAARFAPIMSSELWSEAVESRAALAFARSCQAIDQLDPGRGMLLNYDTLPEAVWRQLCPHFGIEMSENLRQKMTQTATFDSKGSPDSTSAFVPDTQRKQQNASADVRSTVDRIARPAYDQLVARWATRR